MSDEQYHDPFNLTVEQRIEILKALRTYMSDGDMARVFKISKQRIGQILGPRTAAGAGVYGRRAFLLGYADEVATLTRAGKTVPQIIEDFNKREIVIHYQDICWLRVVSGVSTDETKEIRRTKRVEEIRKKLMEFVATGAPFNFYYLRSYDYNLSMRALRVHPTSDTTEPPIKQWADALGVPYAGREHHVWNGKKSETAS